jgi:hypothetical protein
MLISLNHCFICLLEHKLLNTRPVLFAGAQVENSLLPFLWKPNQAGHTRWGCENEGYLFFMWKSSL